MKSRAGEGGVDEGVKLAIYNFGMCMVLARFELSRIRFIPSILNPILLHVERTVPYRQGGTKGATTSNTLVYA